MANLDTIQKPNNTKDHGYTQDDRFKLLLNTSDWNALPKAVRKRFSKRVRGGGSVVYVGEVTNFERHFLGKLLALALRPLGAPLPLHSDVGTPSVVSVTEDVRTGGQIWTRLYAHKKGFPQIVHSAKRFQGATGLEEYIGFGLSIALRVCVKGESLAFESAGYFCRLFGRTIKLPRTLAPLDLVVKHTACGPEQFQFSLDLKAPIVGRLIYQEGHYREEKL